MRIFISHATKNKEVVLKFAEFLESVSSEIEVFCSSENGSIKVGKDFIKTIFEELNSSALFIPVLSKEYYESRFCMIELGLHIPIFSTSTKRKGKSISCRLLYILSRGDRRYLGHLWRISRRVK